MVTENQRPIEFRNHRFFIDIYSDKSEDIVCKKSAQVGYSVFTILDSFHELKYEQRNILYALPTKNVVNDFVVPKVNPLTESNPIIAREMGTDSVSIKKYGNRFIYFKGGFSEREAISVSVDTLVIDEYDRMPSMQIVNMFDSRLQATEFPRRRRFSNPTEIGFGVDALYQDSNQFHWFIKCSKCNHEWYIDFEAGDDKHHYIDKAKRDFVCGKCQQSLTNADRRNGRWVAKYPKRIRHGYWISQMMAPWVTAERILGQEEDMDVQTFHGFVLGKAYTPSDLVVSRETILRANAPSRITQMDVVMGVDQDAGGMYVMAGTPQGIFYHDYVKSWEEVEQLKLTWNAIVVCDPNPYSTMPKQMAAKYNDWFLCYFKETKDLSMLNWKDQVVYADRTRVLDAVADEITQGKYLFREHAYKLEDIITHWNNIYRTTEEKEDGRTRSVWLKKDGKQSDWPFAHAYLRIGLSRTMAYNGAGVLHEPTERKGNATDTVLGDGRVETTLGGLVQDTLDNME
jgi:hypothetical protein